MLDNSKCQAHSGFDERIKKTEDNVSKLWNKWDSMQKWVIGAMVTAILTCMSVIGMFIFRVSK